MKKSNIEKGQKVLIKGYMCPSNKKGLAIIAGIVVEGKENLMIDDKTTLVALEATIVGGIKTIDHPKNIEAYNYQSLIQNL